MSNMFTPQLNMQCCLLTHRGHCALEEVHLWSAGCRVLSGHHEHVASRVLHVAAAGDPTQGNHIEGILEDGGRGGGGGGGGGEGRGGGKFCAM